MTLVETEIYNTASEILETKRIPDPYLYCLNSWGKLILAYTGQVVEDYIETDTQIGKAELEGLLNLQNWFNNNNEGVVGWFSLSYIGVYDSPKIIISEIIEENNIKLLFNRAIVLDDLSDTDALLYARDLSGKFSTADELRRNPTQISESIDWLNELSNYIDISEIKSFIESGRDRIEKGEAIRKAKILHSEAKRLGISNLRKVIMLSPEFDGLFGNNLLRCVLRSEKTAFQNLFENSHIIYGKEVLCCTCPFCGHRVEAEIYDGEIHCPRSTCRKKAPYKKAA